MSPQEYLSNFTPLKKEYNGVVLPQVSFQNKDNFEFLKELAYQGHKKHTKNFDAETLLIYEERLERELSVIRELNYQDYFLLVWDIINYCRNNDISTGPGRGSAGGSLVMFYLGVIQLVDPVKHKLLFERFISKARAKCKIINGVVFLDDKLMCDVDIDVDSARREEVIKYLSTKYPGQTARICNYTTLSGKALMNDVLKIMCDFTADQAQAISDHWPIKFNQPVSLEECDAAQIPELLSIFKDPLVRRAVERLIDLITHRGTHACGILIAPGQLVDYVPYELSGNEIRTMYDMEFASKECTKVDLLGLANIAVLDKTCRLIGIDKNEIDIFDQKIYDFYQNDFKYPKGIFQIDAPATFRVAQQVKPRDFGMISDVIAICRPGAIDLLDQYLANDQSGNIESVHEVIDPILADSKGISIYQENLMHMIHAIGFTLEEAEIIRRIVGKKKVDEIAVWEERIYNKCKENNIPESVAEYIWQVANNSASYSFNKSHSADYGAVTASTTWLKVNYPLEFFTVLFQIAKTQEEITEIERELSVFGIKLLPPDLVKSDEDFKIEGKNIRFGLSSIKKIGGNALKKLMLFRNEYMDCYEFWEAAEQAKLDITTLSALIQAGCLDSLVRTTRSKLAAETQFWRMLTPRERREFRLRAKSGKNAFKLFAELKEAGFFKESRLHTLSESFAPCKAIYEQNSKNENFANWYYERYYLGFSYSTLLKNSLQNPAGYSTINEFNDLETDDSVRLVGIVEGFKRSKAKSSGKEYVRIDLSDETGVCAAMIWEHQLDRLLPKDKPTPQKENVLNIKGRKWNDCLCIDSFEIEDAKIWIQKKDARAAMAAKKAAQDAAEQSENEEVTSEEN